MNCALKTKYGMVPGDEAGSGQGLISNYHLIGIDIMLDEDYNAWLLEINSSPSVAIYQEDPNNPGVREPSDIDRDIKFPMICDVLQLVDMFRKDKFALDNVNNHHSLVKIYSNSLSNPEPDLNVLHNIKIIYDSLAEGKGEATITPAQFATLLHKSEALRQGHLQESDMEVIYSMSIGRQENHMNLVEFSSVIYQLFIRHKGKHISFEIIFGPANLICIDHNYEGGSEEMLESMFPGFLNKIVSEMH